MLSPSASAYSHFVRYLSRTGPFVAIPEKFDLFALPNRTLNFYISEQGPNVLAANDSFASVISQIRRAAKTWSDVELADIQLTFGGMLAAGATSNGPAVDILFSDDIPPGIIAFGGPTSRGEIIGPAVSAPFVPIQRSVVVLRRNLTDYPSYGERFFLTVTHEMGHALGLQHSLASGVMSTERTRGTTKAKPLSSDDIAGLSMLYPARTFASSNGAITGRVTLGGAGVNLASVVAIPPAGTAVSALTHPDGTFRIDGVPPGQYHVYAHPLPPAGQDEATPANINLPLGPDGRPFAVGQNFDTVFFPGLRDPAVAVTVTAGSTTEGVNFNVNRRNNPAIWSVESYSFVGQLAVRPALLNRSTGRGFMVATGIGLMTAQGAVTAGLSATPIGGAAGLISGSLRPYTSAYVQMDLAFNPFTSEGPHHMVFSATNDIYVLPSAFHIVSKNPPAIVSVTNVIDNGVRGVAVNGTSFAQDTRFFFDGQQAAVRSIDDQTNRAVVVPPPAAAGHRAAVIALNSDGQSSSHVQGSALTMYTYDASDPVSMLLNPNTLTPGSEAMVEVTTTGTSLVDGLAHLGFGSADIQVRRVWVLSPTRLLVNVGVSANASIGTVNTTLVNGLQVISQSNGFTVTPATARPMIVFPMVANASNGQSFVQPGSAALVFVNNLPAGATPGSLSVTLNDQPAVVTGVNGSQVTFLIPAAFPAGPAVLRIRAGTETALPVVIPIDPPSPQILSLQSGGLAIDATRPVRGGDQITVLVAGLIADAFTGAVSAQRLVVTVGNVEHAVQSVTAASAAGQHQVTFSLSPNSAAGTQLITVAQDGRISNSASLPVR